MKIIKSVFLTAILGFLFFQNINAQKANDQYFELKKHYSHLLEEDKMTARTILETQLIVAKNSYEYEIAEAINETEKEKWLAAFKKTKIIIREVYEEEVASLKKAFEKAIERLDEKYMERKRSSRNSTRG